MRYNASYLETLGETRIELVSNTYSDSWPLLRRIQFRKLAVDLNAQCLPLAVAILTRQYCGDVFEFSGIRIGSEYADAIRTLLGPQTNLINVDGFHRSFSTGELDIAVGQAGKPAPALMQVGSAPLARVDWSGDFVDRSSRASAGFVYGAAQTNAAFFADPFSVSVAVGLLFGRDRCGTLHVAETPEDARHHSLVEEALRIIGITLQSPTPAQSNLRRSA